MDESKPAPDARARAAALFSSLAKFAVSLKPEQAEQIMTGASKPVILGPGQRIVEQIVGLDQALKLLQGLTEEDRANLKNKSASLTFLRPGQILQAPMDLDPIVAQMEQLPTEGEVIRLLLSDRRLTVDVLKQVAAKLNIRVPSSVKNKGPLQRHIAEEFVGHRRRTQGF